MNRRTRRAMEFSRGLILGRILTTVYHLYKGIFLLSLVGIVLTGHLGLAIFVACVSYVICKALEYSITRAQGGTQ